MDVYIPLFIFDMADIYMRCILTQPPSDVFPPGVEPGIFDLLGKRVNHFFFFLITHKLEIK